MNSKKSYRSYFKRFAGYVHDVFTMGNAQAKDTNVNNDINESFFIEPLPEVNERPIDPLHLDIDIDQETVDNPKDKGKLKVNVSVDDLFRTNQSIVDFDKQISDINAQSIDYQHKMNELSKEISQFTSEKNQLKQIISSKDYSQ
jgi:chromosome segregation ATPase